MRKRRAIVYDDDPSVLSFLKDFFSSIDYEVLTYQKPVVCPLSREDEGRCDKRYPCADVIITDYQMPRMSGHTQRRDRASGVPLEILEHIPPKPESAYFLLVLSPKPLTLRGALPHYLSLKNELAYSSS